MTLHSQNQFSIPEETARVARAAYPKGNIYMKMRDALGTIYQDESFAWLVSVPMTSRDFKLEWLPKFVCILFVSGSICMLAGLL
jgi:transposase